MHFARIRKMFLVPVIIFKIKFQTGYQFFTGLACWEFSFVG